LARHYALAYATAEVPSQSKLTINLPLLVIPKQSTFF
jgi:hypothetical protein